MRVGQLLAEPMDIQYGSSGAECRRREERAVQLLADKRAKGPAKPKAKRAPARRAPAKKS